MIGFLKKNKVTIGGVAAIAVALYLYLNYFGGGSAPLTASSEADSVSSDLLVTLGSLHTIKLDNGIFVDPAFVSLSDFGVEIPPQEKGRRNPFAPAGQGSLGTTTAN